MNLYSIRLQSATDVALASYRVEDKVVKIASPSPPTPPTPSSLPTPQSPKF
ncbi:hypothetical protein [Anabaena azotica]|uniref:Uncharacterized protein n=1 Tax=Anabaena azotica FACHB-119 TaxID=947527 RepID=A0ABR8D4Z3_9NOST|nr:hypothetical protein [Anabaena azotica]MBD2501769.1 hypothetical protein [Anabaena azotica FACHB-119]